MSINSVCNKKVVTIQKHSTLEEAANLMHKNHVGCLVVVEAFNGGLIPAGIITDRDIALSIGSIQKAKEIRVEQIMQTHPVTVKESEGIYETIVKMRTHGIKRVPVVHLDGSLFGIVSADDLLHFMGEEISNISNINEIQLKKEQGINISTEKFF